MVKFEFAGARTWENIVSISGGYRNPKLVDIEYQKARSYKRAKEEGRLIVSPRNTYFFDKIKEVVSQEPINVLDIGGGFGTDYLDFINTLDKQKYNLQSWRLYDSSERVALLKDLFVDDSILEPINSISSAYKSNVILFNTSFQYIEDCYGLLNDLLILNIERKLPALLIFRNILSMSVVDDSAEAYLFIQYSNYLDNGFSAGTETTALVPPDNNLVSYPVYIFTQNGISKIIDIVRKQFANITIQRAIKELPYGLHMGVQSGIATHYTDLIIRIN